MSVVRFIYRFVAGAGTALVCSGATAPPALSAPEPTAICHVSVINVANGRVQEDTTVLLADGAITAIGKRVSIGKARGVDGTGKFLIPGLWDMHVHCCNADDRFFPLFLANGITGIRDMAGPIDELRACRSNVESGAVLGPRVVFAGPMVDGPKPCWADCSIAVGTPEQGRKAVATVQQGGADFVKVYSLLPREAYFAIADEAKRRHIDFAGHVPDAITAAEASDAGQKSFEHLFGVLIGCSSREEELRQNWSRTNSPRSHIQVARELLSSYDAKKAGALFARFRRNGTWQCPTLTVLNSLAHINEPVYANDPRLRYLPSDLSSMWNAANTNYLWKAFSQEDRAAMSLSFAKRCELVATMARSRVGILAGTDTPNPGAFPGFGIHDELALMVKSGLTPLQALQAATLNPARYFGWEKKFGVVRPGKAADLVLLDANPLESITNSTKIAAVFVRGRYLSRAELDRMLKEKR